MRKKDDKRVPVPMETRNVMVGMEIVTATNSLGYVVSTTRIGSLYTGQGCGNLHVNGTQCYDRGIPIKIAIPEDEARGLLKDEGPDREVMLRNPAEDVSFR